MLAEGSEFAGFQITRVLGAGGMGVVYLAQHPRLRRQDALKVLADHLADNPSFRARFLREADTVGSLQHNHIVTVYDRGEHAGRLFMDMQYVAGPSLRELLAERGVLEPELALVVVAQVGSALDAAHRAGVVHRDVKPENVIVASSPGEDDPVHCYLVDFGITALVQETSQLTGQQILGSFGYISPEAARGERVDGRADIYALGCLLVEMLTGEPPFPRPDVMSSIVAHLQEPPPLVSTRRLGLPRALDDIVRRVLAKQPPDRFQSCRELTSALRAAVATAPTARIPVLPVPGAPPPPPIPRLPPSTVPPPPPPRPRRYGQWVAVAAAAVLIVVVAAVVVLLLSSRGSTGAGGNVMPSTASTGSPSAPASTSSTPSSTPSTTPSTAPSTAGPTGAAEAQLRSLLALDSQLSDCNPISSSDLSPTALFAVRCAGGGPTQNVRAFLYSNVTDLRQAYADKFITQALTTTSCPTLASNHSWTYTGGELGGLLGCVRNDINLVVYAWTDESRLLLLEGFASTTTVTPAQMQAWWMTQGI